MTFRPNLVRAAMVSALVVGGTGIATTMAAPASADALCFAGVAATYPKLAALPVDENARAAALNNAVIKMRQAGMSDGKINANLSADYGMTEVGTKPADTTVGGPTRVTAPGNLSVKKPTIYRETCTGKYSIFAYWDWNSIPKLKSDAPSSCNRCAVGGVDIMGINLSRDVDDPGGYAANAWGATSVFKNSAMTIGETNNHGMAMEAQDRFCTSVHCSTDDYNMYHGQIIMSIDDPGCGNLTVHSKYGHSRTGAVLNSLSVGIDSVGIGWSNNAYAFNKAGDGPSNTVKPC